MRTNKNFIFYLAHIFFSCVLYIQFGGSNPTYPTPFRDSSMMLLAYGCRIGVSTLHQPYTTLHPSERFLVELVHRDKIPVKNVEIPCFRPRFFYSELSEPLGKFYCTEVSVPRI